MSDQWAPTPAAVAAGREQFAGLVGSGCWTGWVALVEYDAPDPEFIAEGFEEPSLTLGFAPLAPLRVPDAPAYVDVENWPDLNAELAGLSIRWYSPEELDVLQARSLPVPDPGIFDAFATLRRPDDRAAAMRDSRTIRWLIRRSVSAFLPLLVATTLAYVAGTWWINDMGDTIVVPEQFLVVIMTAVLFLFWWSVVAVVRVCPFWWTLARHPWRAVGAEISYDAAGFTLRLNDGTCRWRARGSRIHEIGGQCGPTAAWYAGRHGGRGIVATLDRQRLVRVRNANGVPE
ncbi:hypothetical protein ATK17_1307 [Branchiibius hedensis]|uniref:Uncharacterized protein n=1 Tax=Branchiibius hedensis TaxID=672460 RepID=A0A2Y8ZRQ9_9MICO|nr:hypothetical protein [Branchiibius hedensis]PWJ25193.1 hypothetical protein ATK17_1307 [Branchiibius hedensis]SSA34008.1 hypothetical protein SAMN04489750_1307 [Branchiibius hedensis]